MQAVTHRHRHSQTKLQTDRMCDPTLIYMLCTWSGRWNLLWIAGHAACAILVLVALLGTGQEDVLSTTSGVLHFFDQFFLAMRHVLLLHGAPWEFTGLTSFLVGGLTVCIGLTWYIDVITQKGIVCLFTHPTVLSTVLLVLFHLRLVHMLYNSLSGTYTLWKRYKELAHSAGRSSSSVAPEPLFEVSCVPLPAQRIQAHQIIDPGLTISSSENASGCCLCISDYRPIDLLLQLPCRHNFHEACVTPWLQKAQNCPVCRGPAHLPSNIRSVPVEVILM